MPHCLNFKPNYIIDFTADEYRIVTMALAGILKDEEDIKAAKQLNVHLCHIRATMIKDALRTADKSLEIAKDINSVAINDNTENDI